MENSSESGDLSFVKSFNKLVRLYVIVSRIAFIGTLATEIFLDPEEVLEVAEA